MIKFFKNIRKANLTEGNTANYLKYAIGEIVLVVIGILIALQINNWNEKRKSNAKTQDYYVQLLDDLNSDIVFAENTIKNFSIYLEQYQEYTNSYNNDLLTPNQVYEQISKLPVMSTSLTFNSSTIETLQNSGEVGLIPSEIRNKLIDLKRHQNLIIKRAEYTDEGKNGIIQNLNPLLGSTTLPERLIKQPKLSEFFDIDKNIRELILVYEGVHRWKSVSEQQSKDRLQEMLKEIDIIISLIKKVQKK